MKKSLFMLLCLTAAFLLFSCGKSGEETASDGTEEIKTPESETASEETGEMLVGIPNPVVPADGPEGIKKVVGFAVKAPEGAENARYSVISKKIAQIDFELDGKSYTFRAAKSDEDFSGLYGAEIEDARDDLDGPDGALYREIDTGGKISRIVRWKNDGVSFLVMNVEGASKEDIVSLFEKLK